MCEGVNLGAHASRVLASIKDNVGSYVEVNRDMHARRVRPQDFLCEVICQK